MEANDHFNFTGLPPAPAASGLKPSPSSGEGLYTNGSPMNFPQQGKSECEGHVAWEGVGIISLEWIDGVSGLSSGLATSPQLSFMSGGKGGSESSELQLLERNQAS